MNGSSKKVIKVLRLASFTGNIGDLANHAGVKNLFNKFLDFEFEFYDLEIREYYWKKKSFDSSFIELVNSYDLVVIGGGNYFEVWVEGSSTGTSIDIDLKLIKQIHTPVLFYSLGIDIGQGYTKNTAENFKKFIEISSSRENIFLSIRNDGSYMAAKELLGEVLSSKFTVIPDGGFFLLNNHGESNLGNNFDYPSQKLGINLAGDMLESRLGDSSSQNRYMEQMVFFIEKIVEEYPAMEIQLIPHIWKDSQLYGRLLPLIKDEFLRKKISISGLKPFGDGLKDFIVTYSSCSLVLGTRFHANVCPIGLGVPTRGLCNYPQIEKLYAELGLENRANNVRLDFSLDLLSAVRQDIKDLKKIQNQYLEINKKLHRDAENGINKIDLWLKKYFPLHLI